MPILFAWNHESEKEVEYPHLGRRSWRWILEVDRSSVGVHEQVRFDESGWHHVGRYLNASVTKYFDFGPYHGY